MCGCVGGKGGSASDSLLVHARCVVQACRDAETATTVAAGAEGRAVEAAEQRVQVCLFARAYVCECPLFSMFLLVWW